MSTLRILHVEDSESDAALIGRTFEKSGMAVETYRVDDAEQMREALAREPWDAVICDYRLPGFDAPRALEVLRASGLDLPFIVVSGTIGEDLAVSMMRAGAHDYLLKDQLTRLVPAVEREVRDARNRALRRETERQLKESQDRLTLAVETTGLGTFDYYVQDDRLVWSGMTRQLFGIPAGETISALTYWNVVYPPDQLRVRRLGIAALKGRNNGEFSFEYRARRLYDGELRWFSTWGRVLFEDGKPQRIIGASRDITPTKHAEQALQYQRDLTQSIMQQTSDSIFVTDRSGCVTFVNPEAERVFGFTQNEMLGKDLHELIHHHYRDGRVFPRAECSLGQLGAAGESLRDFEDILFRKDGSPVQTSCSSSPLELNGEKIGVVVTIRDITERKRAESALRESEARFRRLAEAGIVGMFISDSEYVLEANDCVIALLGYTRENFPFGKIRWRDLTPPDHREPTEQAAASALRTGTAPPYEKEYLRKDGSRVPVLVGVVMIDYQGKRCFFSIVLDRTAHRNLEEQVRQSQRLDSLGQLAGGVAHDFNNLLTIILGYSRMISGDLPAGHTLLEPVEQIVRAAERAASLTRQLLTFSRQDQSQAKILLLNTVVRDADQMLKRLITDNVLTELSLNDAAGFIRADPGHVEQVLVNLALNARDAMPHGGTIWIETAPLVADEFAALCMSIPPGEYVQLIVSDSGVGMTPEVQSRIFEPFFTTKEPDKGTGLGLSTVYGIVKQSGGTISVHSGVGLGTTFRILFPAVKAPAGGQDRQPESREAEGGKGTILLVEDEEGVLKYVNEILMRAGYAVLGFSNAGPAIEAAAKHTGGIDLLITDFVLPGATGSDIARKVQELRPGIPVLIMSGYTDRLGKRKEDAAAYLQKPFTAADLLAKIRSLVPASR